MNSSLAIPVTVRPEQPELVLNAERWTELTAICLGEPEFEHRLSLSNQRGVRVLPGQVLSFSVAPGTEVYVRTTEAPETQWTFIATAMPQPPQFPCARCHGFHR